MTNGLTGPQERYRALHSRRSMSHTAFRYWRATHEPEDIHSYVNQITGPLAGKSPCNFWFLVIALCTILILAANPLTCIWTLTGSDFSNTPTPVTGVFVVVLSPFRQIPGKHFEINQDSFLIRSFQYFIHSVSSIIHSAQSIICPASIHYTFCSAHYTFCFHPLYVLLNQFYTLFSSSSNQHYLD